MSLKIIDEYNWDLLKRKIKSLNVFNPGDYSNSFLQRRVEFRLRVTKLDSYMKYSNLLDKSREERKNLLNELSINFTHFFRDSSTYKKITELVIPQMVSFKKSRKDYQIKIWSAGCATGEEPYSIAILFNEALKKKIPKFNLSVLATDIDKDAIETAKKGIFEEKKFKETTGEIKEKYFDKVDGKYRIKESIRKLVEFRVKDLLSPFKPTGIDIVLCRNIVIYFDLERKSKLYVDIYNLLNDGGFLILGKTETLLGPAREMFGIVDERDKIYIKN